MNKIAFNSMPLLFFFVIVVHPIIAQDNSTIICGQYLKNNKKVKTISIDVFNILDEHSTTYLAFVDDSTGKFRFEFPQNITQEIIFKSDIKLNLILSQGDSLNITIDENKVINFSGKIVTINQDLLNYSIYKSNRLDACW